MSEELLKSKIAYKNCLGHFLKKLFLLEMFWEAVKILN